VLTPLRAPETCAQIVSAAIFVRGGEDYEVANPRLFNLTPGSYIPPEPREALEAQGGATEVEGDLCHTMGEDDPLSSTLFSGHSQGEYVSSMLTLLKRYEQVVIPASVRTQIQLLQPWSIFTTYTAPTLSSDRHSSILSCFAFMRGGVRLRNMILGNEAGVSYFEQWNNGIAAEWYNLFTSQRRVDTAFPVVTARVHYDKAGEGGAIAFPFQSNYRFCPTQWVGYTALTTPSQWYPSGTLAMQGYSNLGTDEPARDRLLLRAFDDDFQPIFWVGIPGHTILP